MQALEQGERVGAVMAAAPDRDLDFEDQENEGTDSKGLATGKKEGRRKRN